jgi:hypothetical protein
VAFLPTKALDFGHGDPLHANAGERFAHLIEVEGFDDGGNKFDAPSLDR